MDYVREAFFSMIGDYRRGTFPGQVERHAGEECCRLLENSQDYPDL